MPGGRFALLIATGRYDTPGLSRLRSPAPDAEGLAEVLSDPQVGDFAVQSVIDGRHGEVSRAMEEFFLDRSRDDLLLLHLSCHGIKNDNGELYFAARDTDQKLLASTAVSGSFLQIQMRRCRARSIVLLLDCCYSGAFLHGTKGDTTVHVRDELAGHGRAVITATNRTEYAWEGDHVSALEPGRSRFTGAVIEGLRTGEADLDRDGAISVHELYDYVYERILAAGVRQRPQMWAELEYRVTIAKAARTETVSAGAPEPSPILGRLEKATSRSDLGAQLKALRARAGEAGWPPAAMCTAAFGKEVAGATDRNQWESTVERWLTGRSLPTNWADLESLVRALGASPEEMTAFREAYHYLRDLEALPTASEVTPPAEAGRLPESESLAEAGPVPEPESLAEAESAPVTRRRAHLRDQAVALAVGLLIAVVAAGYMAALQADPGPSVVRMVVFGVLGLLVAVLAFAVGMVSTVPTKEQIATRSDLPALLLLVGSPLALLAGLIVPPLAGSDVYGHWLADLVGLL